MRNFQFKTIIALTGLSMAVGTAHSKAAVITSQGFETTNTDPTYWAYDISGASGTASTANPSSDTPASSRVNSGSASFQDNNGTSTVTFASVGIAGQTSAAIQLHLAAISTTGGNGLDTGDTVTVFVSLNGAAFSATPDLTVGGSSNARWSYTSGTGVAETTVGTPLTFAPTTGGSRTTDGYSLLKLDIPDGYTSVALKIVAKNDSTGEVWAIDDVSVSAIPEPATLSLLGVGVTALLARRRCRKSA